MAEQAELFLAKREIVVARLAVLDELEHRKLYEPNLIYRGFGRYLIDSVLRYGSESSTSLYIYGNEEWALGVNPDPHWINPLSYALYGGALAIYKGNQLIPEAYTTYRFPDLKTKLQVLVAIFSF